MAQVLEITTLRPAPGLTPEDFITANADIDDYLRRRPGFLWRRRCDTNNPAPLPILRVPLPQRESTTYDFNELLSAKSQTSSKARQVESSQGTPAPSA